MTESFAAILERCHDTKGRPLVKVVCSVCDRAALSVYETDAVPLAEARWRTHKQADGRAPRAAMFWPLCEVEPDGMFSAYFPVQCRLHGPLGLVMPDASAELLTLATRARRESRVLRHVLDPQ